jgi:hypothetical protein
MFRVKSTCCNSGSDIFNLLKLIYDFLPHSKANKCQFVFSVIRRGVDQNYDLLGAAMQRLVAIPYRRFGTTFLQLLAAQHPIRTEFQAPILKMEGNFMLPLSVTGFIANVTAQSATNNYVYYVKCRAQGWGWGELIIRRSISP